MTDPKEVAAITDAERHNFIAYVAMIKSRPSLAPVGREMMAKAISYEARLRELEAENERLKVAQARWREDAAARLELYLSMRKSKILGTASQIDVSLIMPTLAMLDADKTGEYDWSDIDALNVDDLVMRARAALKEE